MAAKKKTKRIDWSERKARAERKRAAVKNVEAGLAALGEAWLELMREAEVAYGREIPSEFKIEKRGSSAISFEVNLGGAKGNTHLHGVITLK